MKKLKLIYTLLVALTGAVVLPYTVAAQYGPFKNYTAVGGNASIDNKAVDDNNNVSFSFPMIGLGKTAGTPAIQADGSYNITYTFTVKNYGQYALSNVQVYDTLTATGRFVSPVTYTVKSIAANSPLKAVTAAAFTGTGTGTALLNASTSTLAVGATATITLVINVVNNSFWGTINNSATATATTSDGVAVFDVSTNSTNPDKNSNTDATTVDGNPFNNNTVTPVTFTQPDIAVTKAVDNSTPYVGGKVVFTITAKNVSTGDAASSDSIVISDALPAGYTYVSATVPATTRLDLINGVWKIAAIKAGVTYTLTITATVNDAGPYANTATVQFPADGNSANNTATATPVPVKSADISVVKTVSSATPYVGDKITYTLAAANNGPSAATNVVVTDTLHTGFTIAGTLPSSLTYNATTRILTWNVGSLALNGTGTVSFDVTVNANATGTEAYVNRAVIGAAEHDPVLSNDTSAVSVSPVASADLEVKKTITATSPLYAGDDVTFTVTVTNKGLSNATGVVVKDTLRNGYTYKSSTPAGYDATTHLWTIGNLAAGASATLSITATANADMSSFDYGNIAYVGGNEHDPSTDNNIDSIQSPAVTPLTDLVIKKTVDSTEARVEVSNVVFTVAVTNNGPSKATNVAVNDLLPAGYTFVSADPSAAYNSTTGVWTIGDLNYLGTATLKVTATLKANAATEDYTNIAKVTGSETDKNTDNNTDSAKVKPVPVVDLVVKKTYSVTGTPFYAGDPITFTLSVTNNGPSDATNVVLTDVLRSGYTYQSSSPAGYNTADGTWSIGNLASGASTTLQITAVSNADLSTYDYGNVATVTSTEFDKDETNNIDSIQSPTVTPLTDLEVKKTVGAAQADVGSQVTFTLTVTNHGPSAATGVKVDEQLPNGYTFVSASPAAQYDDASHTWTIGNLANQASTSLTLVATVNAAGDGVTYTNIAVVSGNEKDKSTDNNTDSAKITSVAVTDLAITKSITAANPLYAGNEVTFTLTVTNNGPSAATGVTVSDKLAAGYTFKSASDAGYDAASGVWTIGNLANGATATLNIVAVVNADQAAADYGNTATVTGNEKDPTSSNNTSTITTPVVTQATDLEVVKTVDKTTANINDQVTFTITVTNHGPSNATGVKVTDALPSGYTFVSADPSAAYNSTSGVWSVGNLANGASSALKIVTTLNASGVYLNTATGTGDQADTNTDNNTGTATATVNPNPIAVDDDTTTEEPTPVIIPVLNNDHAQAGSLDVTTIVIKSQPAHGTVTVNGDGTVTYTPESGYEGDDSFTYTVKDSNGNESNVATVTIEVTKRKVDLSIVKRIITDKSAIAVGSNVSFEILVKNNSTKTASDVEVIDILQANLGGKSVTAVPSVGTAEYDNATKRITWTIGTLEGGATATIVITAQVIAGGDVENTAVVSGSDDDPDPSNNTSSVTTNNGPDDLFIPNVITPNGDGLNDKFVILGLSAYPGSPIMIYNRWGNMVFQSSSYQNDWTGKGLNDGTYYYILTVNKPTGKRVYKGWIQKLN